jgi:hypothetical protein
MPAGAGQGGAEFFLSVPDPRHAPVSTPTPEPPGNGARRCRGTRWSSSPSGTSNGACREGQSTVAARGDDRRSRGEDNRPSRREGRSTVAGRVSGHCDRYRAPRRRTAAREHPWGAFRVTVTGIAPRAPQALRARPTVRTGQARGAKSLHMRNKSPRGHHPRPAGRRVARNPSICGRTRRAAAEHGRTSRGPSGLPPQCKPFDTPPRRGRARGRDGRRAC